MFSGLLRSEMGIGLVPFEGGKILTIAVQLPQGIPFQR